MQCRFVFVFAVAVVTSAFADESPLERITRLHKECQSDPATVVKDSVLEDARKGNVDVDAIGPHTLCMNVKLGMQKPNGDIDKDELREAVKKLGNNINEATVENIVNDCGKRVEDTPNEAAITLYQCYARHAKTTHGKHLESLTGTD
ncbi:uncharacterized protein [Leptinotarsa decemlineata]|uniref:uncharacterized protein n=1 Tax=Leptinotarsa decemlineata TaxID=7539 RepID=UPI003D30828A